MTDMEFERIWTLFGELFPASAKGKSAKSKRVWQVALAPYEQDAVSAATLVYARRNKFFPDVADITGNLPVPGQTEQEENRRKDAVALRKYLK